jgi:hypothetical protein
MSIHVFRLAEVARIFGTSTTHIRAAARPIQALSHTSALGDCVHEKLLPALEKSLRETPVPDAKKKVRTPRTLARFK